MLEPHPVGLVVDDDFRRSRLTVFFRLILAIPHYIWFFLWSILAILVAIINWFATLILGRPPEWAHRFLCAFIRYGAHLSAYLYLVANPYPGFMGEAGTYPIDVSLPSEPQAQARWKTLLRLILVIPALLIGGVLGGSFSISGSFLFNRSGGRRSNGYNGGFSGGGLLAGICAVLGWFASLATGRMPTGLRDAGAYGVGYSAQVRTYLFVLTDRYPNSDPLALLETVPRPPQHPVHLVGEAEDLRRSRLLVLFRLPLFFPHYIWLSLWGIAVFLASIVNWFATLITGRPVRPIYRFVSRYVRYGFHVYAFLTVAANPFPGFTGQAGSYPLDLAIPDEPQRQNRWKTLFRLFLVIPAFMVSFGVYFLLLFASMLTWFVALIRGSAPWGLRNAMAYALRYIGQVNAYLYLVTDAYPHASPLEGADPIVESADTLAA
jgi:ABC-type multidrug transport system fused ATPase/permease subunit